MLPQSAAAKIGHNGDLLREIFLCVPGKYISQLKFVSKQWMNIICNEEFHIEHSKRNMKPSSFVIYDIRSEYKRPLFLDVELIDPPRNLFVRWKEIHAEESVVRNKFKMPCKYVNGKNEIEFLNSCNGLILCRDNMNELYVCNGTTKQSRRLPFLNIGENGFFWSMCLSFDPSQSTEYKVCCLWATGNPITFRVYVYSSRTASWRLSIAGPLQLNARLRYYGYNAVSWKNKIFWMIMDEENILCYDVVTERVEMKVVPTNTERHYYFGASCGRLIIVNVAEQENYPQMLVYEMLGDQMNWFLMYRISFSNFGRTSPVIHQKIAYMTSSDIHEKSGLLGFFQGSRDKHHLVLVLWINGHVVSYNVLYNKTEVLYRLPVNFNKRMARYWEIHQYVDSLISI